MLVVAPVTVLHAAAGIIHNSHVSTVQTIPTSDMSKYMLVFHA